MPIVPYTEQLADCLKSIEKQTAKFEVFIVEQPVERYINKNRLLNNGFKKSKGDFVMHCDADFRLTDPTILQRMADKIEQDKLDCIYPKFHSRVYGELKIADGGPMFTQTALMKCYPLNENLKGVSWVTFPLLNYAVKNLKFHCSDEFVIEVDQQRGGVARRHGKTASMLRPVFKETVKILKGKGAWPA
jgi:glycosyltransferase involved in cell wall biosynthesis